MRAQIEQLKAMLHETVVGQWPALEWFVINTIDLLTGWLTGQKTRYYWPELACALAIAAIVYLARDRAPGGGLRGFIKYVFPREMYIHPSTWVDIKLLVANHFVTPLINITWRAGTPLFVSLLVGFLTSTLGPAPQNIPWTTTVLLLYTGLWILADEFGYFLVHYASHKVPWLWAFHKVHHSAETLQLFANVRGHPVETLLTIPFRAATTSLVMAPAIYWGAGDIPELTLFGISAATAAAALIGNQLHHTNIWISWGPVLEKVFMSPAMHQIHHSTAPEHWDRNMGGNLAVWDWLFGTIYIPRRREQLTFGIGNGVPQPHPSVTAAFVVPFLEILPARGRIAAWLRPAARFLPSSWWRAISDGRGSY